MPNPPSSYATPPMNWNGVQPPLNLRVRQENIVLSNGANNNIARNDSNYLRLTGPSADFSITGFDAPLAGMLLYVQVAITQQLTITNQAGSAAANQIITSTGDDVVITSTPCLLTFVYDSAVGKWIFGGAQAKSGSGSSDEEVYSLPGALTVGAGALRLYNRSSVPWVLTRVYISVGTAPTGADLIVDVNINGTTIFTTQANRPTIAASANTGTSGVPDVTTVNVGEYLTVDVDQVGSTVAGSNLVVQFPVVR